MMYYMQKVRCWAGGQYNDSDGHGVKTIVHILTATVCQAIEMGL